MSSVTQPRRVLPVVTGLGVAFVAVAVAALLTGAVVLPSPLDLRPELVVLALTVAVASPLLFSRWRMTFWAFLGWLMVEDLIRKFLGNDIRVYFLKDLLYVLLVAGLVADPAVRGTWKRATGEARFALYGLITWSVVAAIVTAFVDWRVPLIGLRLDWMYAPLVLAGYLLALRPDGLRRLLAGFVLIGIPVSLLGIAQGILGSDFLRPDVATPGLGSLDLVRAGDVFQPSGTFADPGRFASMALLTFASGLALLMLCLRLRGSRSRLLAVVGSMVGGVAVWIGGSKTGIIVSAALVAIATVAPAFAERRPAFARGLITFALIAVAAVVQASLFPSLTESRVSYLQTTLDPRASSNEWDLRFDAWIANTYDGLARGGLVGKGTGVASLGLQYLGSDPSDLGAGAAITGVDGLEGGFAAVALEWGVIGLALWLLWSILWMQRQWRAIIASRGSLAAAAGLVVFGWMFYFLFFGFVQGFQAFQNYYANAYFWILSGLLFALPSAMSATEHGDRGTR